MLDDPTSAMEPSDGPMSLVGQVSSGKHRPKGGEVVLPYARRVSSTSPASCNSGYICKCVVTVLLCCATPNAFGREAAENPSQTKITGYYTRLPFDDNGYSGKYADIVIDLPGKGRFVFSREYSYQPYWAPVEKGRYHVARLIPRKGNGPEQRPDKHNICSNASIVKKAETSVTVHWRYAPDLTKESFVDFLSAYNKAGNPASFYQ